jgi:tetratricopeptide (TPR) repeat protein
LEYTRPAVASAPWGYGWSPEEVTIAPRTGKLATLGVLAAILCAVTGRVPEERPRASPERSAIFAAIGSVRPVEARLVGAPFAPLGASPLNHASRIAISSRLREAAEKGSPEALGDLGIALLLDGRLDDSVDALERAVALDRGNSRAESDLAAAYQARASRLGFDDAVRALAHAMRAVRLDPSLPEARFNHALALERLSLSYDAREAWRIYLRLSPTSLWAVEGRRHEEALARAVAELERHPDFLQLAATGEPSALDQAIDRDPQGAREYLDEDAFPLWARLVEAKAARIASVLHAMGRVARSLARVEGDRLLADAVGAIENAAGEPESTGRLRALAVGHRQYSEGRRALQAGEIRRAAALFTSSRSEFRRARSPFALWAEVQLGVCSYQDADYLGARARLVPIAKSATAFPSLRGRALWVLGLGDGVQRDLESALARFQQALDLYRKLGEAGNQGAMENLIGETLGYLGRRREAALHRYDTVRFLPDIRDAHRRGAILSLIGKTASDSGFPEVALLLHKEALRPLATGVDQPALVSALLNLADTEVALHRVPDALKDLERARSAIDQMTSDGVREAFLSDESSRLGSLLRRTAPRQAIASLTRSIRSSRRAGYSLLLPIFLKERALALAALGSEDLAEADLREATGIVESKLRQVLDGGARAVFFSQAADLYDEMVQVEIRRGDRATAFAYSDRARSAGLRAGGAAGPPPFRLDPPADTAVIGYSEIGGRLLIWLVRRGDVSLIYSRLSPEKVGELVSMLRSARGRRPTSRAPRPSSTALSYSRSSPRWPPSRSWSSCRPDASPGFLSRP